MNWYFVVMVFSLTMNAAFLFVIKREAIQLRYAESQAELYQKLHSELFQHHESDTAYRQKYALVLDKKEKALLSLGASSDSEEARTAAAKFCRKVKKRIT